MGSHCLNLLSRATAELEQSEESTPRPPVMFRVVLVSCLAAAACGQSLESKDAKILKEQRFAAGDGRFGSAFAQEDGTVFREETTADGERIGQYSCSPPSSQQPSQPSSLSPPSSSNNQPPPSSSSREVSRLSNSPCSQPLPPQPSDSLNRPSDSQPRPSPPPSTTSRVS